MSFQKRPYIPGDGRFQVQDNLQASPFGVVVIIAVKELVAHLTSRRIGEDSACLLSAASSKNIDSVQRQTLQVS